MITFSAVYVVPCKSDNRIFLKFKILNATFGEEQSTAIGVECH